MQHKAIAIDAMSGDFGPRVIIPSTLKFLQNHPDQPVIFVGKRSEIEKFVNCADYPLVSIEHVDHVVSMADKPANVLRSKEASSMSRALDLLAQGSSGSCVSAGNTGALMALSMLKLKTIPGIARPAICGALPSLKSHSYLLDMGANVDSSAGDLLNFAKMAKVLVASVENRKNPSVALLNIGEEDSKGNTQVKAVAEVLQADQSINYIGFVEAHKMYEGVADIILCDGFVGNIALKASEGVASYILEKIKRELKQDKITKALSYLAIPEFLRIKKKIDPRRFNGASFLGINGIVVKSHGHADEEAFTHALVQAVDMMSGDLVGQLNQQFSNL